MGSAHGKQRPQLPGGAEISLHHPAGTQHWPGMILNRVKSDPFQGAAQGDSV